MQRFNRIGFFVIISGIFAALLYKALHVPVVTDEAITLTYLKLPVWDVMMYKDHYPNNHILNSLVTRFFVLVAGDHAIVIRLPNLLSFLLYAFGVFRILKLSPGIQSIWFIPGALLFVSNPYLLDFFTMCRGYGMSCALAVTSISYVLTGFSKNKDNHIFIALLTAIMASYANFTLLVFWIAVSLIFLYYFYLNRTSVKHFIKSFLILTIIFSAYAALIAMPLLRMHESNEFQYWTSQGFYKETIIPLILYSKSGSGLIPGPQIIAFMLFGIILFNIFYSIRHIITEDFTIFKEPVFLTTAVLLMSAGVNILQCTLLKTPNLHGRTALFFYPLTIATLVPSLSLLPSARLLRIQAVFAILLGFICTFHLVDRFRPLWIRDAWYSVHTFEVMNYLRDHHSGSKVSLKAEGSLFHSFNYYVTRGDVPWLDLEPYDSNLDSNTMASYYFLFGNDSAALMPAFRTVQIYQGGMVLMENQKHQIKYLQ